MLPRTLIIPVVACALTLTSGAVPAQQGSGQGAQAQTQEQEQIFGSQLMTAEERAAYRAKMRAANTLEEREQIRCEHHERMVERAKAQGITLPEEPPARGMGSGNMGPGGGGMGPGGGRNR